MGLKKAAGFPQQADMLVKAATVLCQALENSSAPACVRNILLEYCMLSATEEARSSGACCQLRLYYTELCSLHDCGSCCSDEPLFSKGTFCARVTVHPESKGSPGSLADLAASS